MSNIDTARKPHAALDIRSRRAKAVKIERLLKLPATEAEIHLLEVGTGSGGIAHYFASQSKQRYLVDAVDVCDNRQLTDGFRYTQVDGTELPFPNESFDVVLSNHVIEHVGDREAQLRHLLELKRVLKPGAVGYLAVPNRWMFVEPHYRLAFLSWLPRRLRSPYLRLWKKGKFYDCEPLQMNELESMLSEVALVWKNICIEALHVTFEIERPDSLMARWMRVLPDAVLVPFRGLIPTLIYRIERRIE
ncbi:class I SAM-dependent methyltransferase [Dyella dinghuensis]|uniref:Class I SAM-dependent methyltransferase n=1 Tax=Dyella dinghuensis TaxID=1920169 RepID=A0A3S0PD51_9GAMM|nr:class I SAM-dependent methyltransferase [Dyella dinghuensis]RUL62279.1 class I SAM-dependent methyltransferase [Dyella dinghuensis]